MAVIRWSFPNGTNNDTLTGPLAGGDTVDLTGGTAIISNEQSLAGVSSLSAKFDLTVGGSLWYAKESLTGTSYAYDFYLYITTTFGGTVSVGWAGASASARSLSVSIGGSQQRLNLNDSTGTIWQGAVAALPTNAWIRISVFGTCGVGTGTGRVAWYLGHSTTPQEDSGLLTNLSTQTSLNRIRIGGKATATSVVGGVCYFGSWAYDTAATGLIPPYTTGTSVTPWLRGAGTWMPVSMRERDAGAWNPRNTLLK